MEVGYEQKSEEMTKKISQCRQASDHGHSQFLSFPTRRWEMSRKVMKWLESYQSGGRLVHMDFTTFPLFRHGGWG